MVNYILKQLNKKNMAKIIKLNENDLKRIVTKVLNERQQLNEALPALAVWALWTAGAAIVGGGSYMTWFYQSAADKSIEKLHKGCQDPDSVIGKPLMSKQQHIQIANEIGEAIDGWDITGSGEDDIASAFSRVKSVPDYCKVAEEYVIQRGEDMYEALDGDINVGGWDEYVRQPLSKAIRTTAEANKNSENLSGDTENNKKEITPGSGGEEVNKKDNWGMYMCIIEHPKSIPDKFQNGERTRFRIGQAYYMGNGMKLYKGVEVPYSCDDKEFKNVEFENKTNSNKISTGVDADIKDIQRFLTDEGYDISSDGEIGNETAGAIIDYIVDNDSNEFKPGSVLELQKKINSCYSMKIKEDGTVGPETLDAIADALESAQDGDLCK
jgi:hypothetical protein